MCPIRDAVDQAGGELPIRIAGDLPVLTAEQLDADPHGIFRQYRAIHPVVAHELGGYIVLRHADVDQLIKDPPRPRD